MKLKLQLVTQEKTVLQEDADSLTCPTMEGQITILPKHLPLIAALSHGELIARNGSVTHPIAVAGGFIEVRPDSEVIILADMAERAAEIDLAEAEEARERAQESMRKAKENKLSNEEYARLAANLQRALARIQVARKHAPRSGITRASEE